MQQFVEWYERDYGRVLKVAKLDTVLSYLQLLGHRNVVFLVRCSVSITKAFIAAERIQDSIIVVTGNLAITLLNSVLVLELNSWNCLKIAIQSGCQKCITEVELLDITLACKVKLALNQTTQNMKKMYLKLRNLKLNDHGCKLCLVDLLGK